MDFNCDVQYIPHRPKSEIVPDILIAKTFTCNSELQSV